MDDGIREDAFDWLCVLYGLMPNVGRNTTASTVEIIYIVKVELQRSFNRRYQIYKSNTLIHHVQN